MRKLFFIPILLLSLTTMAACSPDEDPTTQIEQPTTPEEPGDEENPDNPEDPENPDDPDTPSDDSKMLVLYFSAQGHTQAVAERIVELTGADIHRIEAADPYAADPYDDSDRIQNEAYNDLRPEVANLLDKEVIAKYDTIFVGSPCWWHQPAMVVCTFPHAIEFLNKPYADIFTILTSYPALENYLSPFMDAWKGNAQDQLQGQIASAKIPLSRMISPQLYWVMTGNDFSLDINNPAEPKILCVGNNPDRQNIYSAALGLYNSRIVKLINKKGQLKSSVIIDELPTIYFRGLDNLIATARSNKVVVCLGFQDYSQLNRDYGDKENKVIQNTVGNIFAGQVVGETSETLSKRFGKVLQRRQSISINRQDTSTSINTQLDSLIPASKIANLSQGTFVGAVSDNFGETIDQKIFHARIIVDNEQVAAETKAYKKIPIINEFRDGEGNDIMQQQIDRNYSHVKADVLCIIDDEFARIKADPKLQHLLPEE